MTTRATWPREATTTTAELSTMSSGAKIQHHCTIHSLRLDLRRDDIIITPDLNSPTSTMSTYIFNLERHEINGPPFPRALHVGCASHFSVPPLARLRGVNDRDAAQIGNQFPKERGQKTMSRALQASGRMDSVVVTMIDQTKSSQLRRIGSFLLLERGLTRGGTMVGL